MPVLLTRQLYVGGSKGRDGQLPLLAHIKFGVDLEIRLHVSATNQRQVRGSPALRPHSGCQFGRRCLAIGWMGVIGREGFGCGSELAAMERSSRGLFIREVVGSPMDGSGVGRALPVKRKPAFRRHP